MASNVILKNKALANVTFVPRNSAGNRVVYVASGSSLLDTMRLELDLRDNGPTNRTVGKLSVPTSGVPASTGVNTVLWTEVGSFDLSSVKAATTIAAEDFHAMFASLIASDAVKTMFVNGVRL